MSAGVTRRRTRLRSSADTPGSGNGARDALGWLWLALTFGISSGASDRRDDATLRTIPPRSRRSATRDACPRT